MAVARRANWSAAEVEATQEGFVLRVPIKGEVHPEWEVAFRRAVDGGGQAARNGRAQAGQRALARARPVRAVKGHWPGALGRARVSAPPSRS